MEVIIYISNLLAERQEIPQPDVNKAKDDNLLLQASIEMLCSLAISFIGLSSTAYSFNKSKSLCCANFRFPSMNVDELLQSENEADWLIKALQRSIIGYLYDEHYKQFKIFISC